MKLVIVILLILIGIGSVFLAGYVYAVRRFGQVLEQMPPLTEQDKAKMAAFFKLVEQTGQRLKEDTNHRHIRADYTSVGFPRREKRLTDIKTAVSFFELESGERPQTLDALRQWGEAHHYSSDRMLALERWINGCRTIEGAKSSYFLTCDSWTPGDEGRLAEQGAGFDPNLERFYLVDRKVVLYVPSEDAR